MISHLIETDRIYHFVLFEKIKNTCEYKNYKDM